MWRGRFSRLWKASKWWRRTRMGEKEDTVCCQTCCGFNKGWIPSAVLYTNSGRRLTPQGQRDLDRIAGQVGCLTLLFKHASSSPLLICFSFAASVTFALVFIVASELAIASFKMEPWAILPLTMMEIISAALMCQS